MKHLLRLLPYVKRYRGLLIVGLVCAVLTKAYGLVVPYATGLAFDNIFGTDPNITIITCYILAIVSAKVAESLTQYLWMRTLPSLSHHVAFDLRNTLYRHLLKLSFSWFARMHTGDIMSRAVNDIQEVRGVLQFSIAGLLRNIFLFAGATTIMFLISVELALLTLLPLLVMTFVIRFLLPRIYSLSMKVQEQLATVSTHAQENFSGIRVVKAYAVEEIEKDKFAELSQGYVEHSMSLVKFRAFIMPMFMIVAQLCTLLALWYGGRRIILRDFTIGRLIMFIGYQQQMLWPMAMFGFMVTRMQRGAAAMARINRILDMEPEIKDDGRTGADLTIHGEIEFKNLSFQYPDSSFAMKDVSLRIPAGATVGIVGPVGSGKSSFVSLIMRLFDVPDGTLFIDGRDINTVPLSSLRTSIGYVPQDSFLFSETIRENISFGKPGVDFAEVARAAEIAQVADDIEQFPDKYDQLVGERGVTLSGGQKQRVAIARAIVLDPKILILDDALSSVDTQTEDKMLREMRRIWEDRTTLIISHRISTIASSDFIVVFDDGGIVEQGTHGELIAQDGLYASIYRKQQLEAQIESEGD